MTAGALKRPAGVAVVPPPTCADGAEVGCDKALDNFAVWKPKIEPLEVEAVLEAGAGLD